MNEQAPLNLPKLPDGSTFDAQRSPPRAPASVRDEQQKKRKSTAADEVLASSARSSSKKQKPLQFSSQTPGSNVSPFSLGLFFSI